MEPSILNPQDTATIHVLEAQVREVFGRTVYSHKIHEKMADEYLHRHNVLKTWQIVLSAVVTGSLLLAVFGDSRLATVIGAILSTLLFGISTYTKDYDFGKIAQRHADVALQLWSIREGYFSLLTDIASGLVGIHLLIEQRNQLQQRLEKVYVNAPRTNSRAYASAQKSLKENEELTFSAEEIDAFLPAELRRAIRPIQATSSSGDFPKTGTKTNGVERS